MTGWSIRKLVKNLRRYRTIRIQAGDQIVKATEPLEDDSRAILKAIRRASTAH